MDSETKTNISKRIFYYQITIYPIWLIGCGCYVFNRKSVSIATPKIMEFGLTKSHTDKLISFNYVCNFDCFSVCL